jgi:hypothetical protein
MQMSPITKFPALAGLLALLVPAPGAAQQSDVALVYRLMLDAKMVVAPAGAAQRQAELGQRLANNDVVITSPNTRAAIRFTDDGSLLRLNPNSQLKIVTEGDRNAVTKTLQLEFGELWTKVTKKDAAQFRVQTPAGVAAVKGTEFIVRVDVNGITTVITLEGIVEFFNGAGTVQIPAGRRVTVTSQTQVPTVVPTTDADLKQDVGLLESDDAPGSPSEKTQIEILMQDKDGKTKTVILEVPRGALRTLLGPGN